MKSLKAAAVVAGSIALAGAAAPAFAHSTADLTPTSLTGAVNTLTSGNLTAKDVMPLQHQSDALNTENESSPLNTVKGATGALNQHNPLLGGLPLQG
ncbi:hypothetical protein DF268_18845 [Streptomyces sp. V2]|uniref:Secreted protein n=2 Tax=Streptomyces niveiscabiei TaxID=164115 RepID=A0ABW9HSR7_9ACTN|nr:MULTISPECIES: hypothetical protein [unclassified Streptomyces]PWG12013.1 hypothetical protein DF268_18845 [Streptomyces sp. V2]QZZ27893.1 hypothetical protein A7X85_17835 [Streptomyces sp. ST1015]